MAGTELPRRIERLIEPSLTAMGYEIVRIRWTGEGHRKLQIMAERTDGRPMDVDDCATISRQISPLLDVADPIQGTYELEVSSPGIDRPLVRPKDFERFAGFEAKIRTLRPIDGRRRFRGRLAGFSNGRVSIITEAGEAEVPIEEIENAKLVLTDELLAATRTGTDESPNS